MRVPNDRLITDIPDHHLSLDRNTTNVLDCGFEFDRIRGQIHQSSQSRQFKELTKLIKLTNDQVTNKTWSQVITLISQIRIVSTSSITELKTTLAVLSDNLAMEFDKALASNITDNAIQNELINKIVIDYARFRCDFIARRNEYRDVIKLCACCTTNISNSRMETSSSCSFSQCF